MSGVHLIIADPWHTLDHERDTTLALCTHGLQLHSSGVTAIYWTTFPQIVCGIARGKPFASALCQRLLWRRGQRPQLEKRQRTLSFDLFNGIHWRADPPVTLEQTQFWMAMANLPWASKWWTHPTGLLRWNEKVAPFRFPTLSLDSLFLNEAALPASVATLVPQSFRKKTDWISKPLHEAASRGVKRSKRVALKPLITRLFREMSQKRNILLQPFVPSIFQGEKRLFVVHGKPIAGLIKHPNSSSGIVTWTKRSQPQICPLTGRLWQRELLNWRKPVHLELGRSLRNDGIHFATLDFIDGSLLEINVTSPGLFYGLDSNSQSRLAAAYWRRPA